VEEAKALRQSLALAQAKHRHLIDPRYSKWIGTWDLLLMMLLVISVIVTPFEIAFLPNEQPDNMSPGGIGLFVFNRIIDAFFFADLVLQFNLAYEVMDRSQSLDGQALSGQLPVPTWVYDRRKIAVRYAKGWLIIDVLSIAPFWLTSWLMSADEGSGHQHGAFHANLNATDGGGLELARGGLNAPKMVRILRSLRLLKFSRLIKASKVMKRIETQMSVSWSALNLPKMFVLAILGVHYNACVWGLTPQLEFGEEYTWIDALRDSKRDSCDLFPRTCGEPLSPWDTYAAALYHATMTVTGIGYGEMLPVNTSERFVSTGLMLLGGFLWCYVTGEVVNSVATMDPEAIRFRGRLDELNYLMRTRQLEKPLQSELRDYLHKTRAMQRMSSEKPLLQSLSPQLQGRIAVISSRVWLECCWYLKPTTRNARVHAAFITDLSSYLTLHGFMPQERLDIGTLYIVRIGLVIQRWRLHNPGHVIGYDMIIDDMRLLDHSEVVSLSYVETFRLTKPDLDAVSRQHPACAAVIRAAARRMRIQRKLLLVIRRMALLGLPRSFVLRREEPITIFGSPQRPENDLALHGDLASEIDTISDRLAAKGPESPGAYRAQSPSDHDVTPGIFTSPERMFTSPARLREPLRVATPTDFESLGALES